MIVASRIVDRLNSLMLVDGNRQSFKDQASVPYITRQLSKSSDYYGARIDDSQSSNSQDFSTQLPDIFEEHDDYSNGVKGKLATVALHGGERNGRQRTSDLLAAPNCKSREYTFKNTEQIIACRKGLYDTFSIQRFDNATLQVEEKIRLLENSESCIVLQNGAGQGSPNTILAQLIQTFVPKGGHIIMNKWATSSEFEETLKTLEVGISYVAVEDYEALEEIVANQKIDMFITQSICIPNTKSPNLANVSKYCKQHEMLMVVDNTVATPIICNPLKFGADLVVHTDSQYLSGQTNLRLGAICGSKVIIDKVRRIQNLFAGKLDVQSVTYLSQGLQTLEVRTQRQNSNAEEIATRLTLTQDGKIKAVKYYGYPECQAFPEKQLAGNGNVVSFDLNTDMVGTSKFVDSLKIPYICSQMGGNYSTVQQPSVLSHGDLSGLERKQLGIGDSLVTMSIGLENVEDLWKDIVNALKRV